MKNNMLVVGGTILMLATTSAVAADSGDYYRSGEFSIDGFGTASVGKHTINNPSGSRVRENTRLGAGAGLNYFITRNIGIGADAYSEDIKDTLIDSASLNVLLRFPLNQGGWAPYILGGGGRHFENVRNWHVQLGAGIEYRFSPNMGMFMDARWVLPDEAKYFGVARLGMRFSF